MRVTIEELNPEPNVLPYREVTPTEGYTWGDEPKETEPKKPAFSFYTLYRNIWEAMWPWIVRLLIPFLFIVRQVIALVLIVKIRYFQDRRISPLAKCPACGCRELHDIQYHPVYERVFHICKICKAEWAQATILPVDRWRVTQAPPVEPPSDFLN